MNKKTLTIIFGMILLSGGVLATNELYNLSGIDVPLNIIAGDTFGGNFSFGYLDIFPNTDNSPLIIQLNFTSDNSSYPVWKGDFAVSGRMEKYAWYLPRYFRKTIKFNCSEEYEQIIEHPLDSQTVQAENGTFYCYNPEGDLQLEEYDKVYLNITSHQALYPGQYNLTASMFYLTDERAPFVNILNKEDFEKYYRELDNIEIIANIFDGSEITARWGEILTENVTTIPYSHPTEDKDYFTKILPIDIVEGDYDLFIFAEDKFGNKGNDSTTLKIDRTGPEIELIQPTEIVYNEILPIELNVTDKKAGVNTSAVYYRLREMDGTNICPEDGMGSWNCYNSDWQTLVFDENTQTYGLNINTTAILDSGEYWFEIRAFDILENEGRLE